MNRPDIEAIEKRVKNAKDLLARKGDNYHIVGTQFFIDNTEPLIAYARELEQRIQEMQVKERLPLFFLDDPEAQN